MNLLTVIDVASIIWDKSDFKINTSKYYSLSVHLIDFINIFNIEKPTFLFRQNLLDEMVNGFPLSEIPSSWDYLGDVVYSFLSNIGDNIVTFLPDTLNEIYSVPDLRKSHYTEVTNNELILLISKMHSHEEKITFFTFKIIWTNNNLRTIYSDGEKEFETISYEGEKSLNEFFNQFKRIFERISKHEIPLNKTYYSKRGPISPLRCTDDEAQNFLNTAIYYEEKNIRKLYNYDEERDVFVVFHNHGGNKFHGYEEQNRDVIPHKIKKSFGKR